MKPVYKPILFNPLASIFMVASAFFFSSIAVNEAGGVGLGIKNAYAAEEGGGSGQHGSEKTGSGKGQGKGPNPDCPYKDGSGRGGYAGAGHGKGKNGKGGHGGSETENPSEATNKDDVLSGGGPGGESFICDGPGNWHSDTKVFIHH